VEINMHRTGQTGSFAQRTGKRTFGSPSGMVPIGNLARNPVSVTVSDALGTHRVVATRGKGGKVSLTCDCHQSAVDGWCQHRVDLMCLSYDAAPAANAELRRAFEGVIGGTPAANAGREADRALRNFNACLQVFDKRRPAEINRGSLGKFTDLISDLAASAGELEDALSQLRRALGTT
jgi:hypothetical protein